MLFHSPTFLFLFLPLVLLLTFVRARVAQSVGLVFASWFFYAWGDLRAFPILLLFIFVNHTLGTQIWNRLDAQRDAPDRAASWLLGLGVAANLLLLGAYKYSFFIAGALAPAGLALPPAVLAALSDFSQTTPLGLSFLVFQAIAYLIDIRRGTSNPPEGFLDAALYFSFFPKVIAGPIVRLAVMEKQWNAPLPGLADVAQGFRRFATGFAKQMLVAIPLGGMIERLQNVPPVNLGPGLAWIFALAVTLQIYVDFSAYTDMALGLARMFGYRLPENFNFPYISQSITEFWRRWHITLSNWFRDYLFFPLERRFRRPAGRLLSVLLVFFLTGLWHGAGWTFIAWGLLNGICVALERTLFGRGLKRAPRFVRHAYALLVIVVGFVLFRSANLESGLNTLASMFGLRGLSGPWYPLELFVSNELWLALAAAVLLALPVSTVLGSLGARATAKSPGLALGAGALRTLFTLALFAAAILMMGGSTLRAFLYFRF